MTSKQPRSLALLGDLVIIAAFPFLGAVSHEDGVTFASFTRTFVPFAGAWALIGSLTPAMRITTIRSVKRTYRQVPPAWLVAGVAAIALRVFAFDRPLVVSFSIVAIAVTGALIIGWRLALASMLRSR